MHDANDKPLARLAVTGLPAYEVEKARPVQLINSASAFEFGDWIRRAACLVIGKAHHHHRVVRVLEICRNKSKLEFEIKIIESIM